MTSKTTEAKERLWLIATPPIIWAVHFLLSYITAAVWCAKFAGPTGSLLGARVAIALYTSLALITLGIIAWSAFTQHNTTHKAGLHSDTNLGRHRFIGLATLMLSGLSTIAILFESLAIVFIGRCD